MAVDDSYTKALLHMDGPDGSTTFSDESGKTWSASGNAQLDTAQSKFNNSSGLFDGTSDFIYTDDHADFQFGAGDFTIDFWVYANSLTGNATLFNKRANSSGFGWMAIWLAATSGNLLWYASANTTTWGIVNGLNFGTITTGGWHHIAVVRTGNTWKAFLDGVQGGGDVSSSSSLSDPATTLKIGADSDNFSLNGWIDEVRISKGIARWTAGFTVPSTPYSARGAQVIMF